jgi:hypothetical protein
MANLPIRLSLVGKQQIIRPFLANVNLLRARVLTARRAQTPANLEALQYILSPNPETRVDSGGSSQIIAAGNVVRAKLNWNSLYP